MAEVFYREYGRDATILFAVYEIDGIDLRKDATIPVGDIFITVDEAVETAADNAATDEGRKYSWVCSAAEMASKRVSVALEDQDGTKVYLDRDFTIETINHPDAMHPNGVTLTGLADAGAASNEIDLGSIGSAQNDLYIGQICHIYEGTGVGQSRPGIDYDGTTKILTISGTWAISPDATSRYRLKPDAVTEITVPSVSEIADGVLNDLLTPRVTADSVAVAIKDILVDTADIQPKVDARLPTALSAGGNIKSDVKEVNDTTITGSGTVADPWGP